MVAKVLELVLALVSGRNALIDHADNEVNEVVAKKPCDRGNTRKARQKKWKKSVVDEMIVVEVLHVVYGVAGGFTYEGVGWRAMEFGERKRFTQSERAQANTRKEAHTKLHRRKRDTFCRTMQHWWGVNKRNGPARV